MVVEIVTLLQNINKTIEGINTAPIKYPGALNTANLPCVLVWPGRGTTRKVTAKAIQVQSERVYSVRVYVEPSGQSNYDIPSWTSMELLPRFIETYYRNEVLADGFAIITGVNDSGIMAGGELAMQAGLTYAGVAYKGFVLSLTVLGVIRLG